MEEKGLSLEFSENSFELSDRQLVEQFFKSRKSEATSNNYWKGLSYVLSYDREDREGSISKIGDFVTFARRNHAISEFKMRDWILDRKGTVAGATLRSYVSATKSLLDFCGVTLNWKQIQSVMPDARRTADDDATPIEATRKLWTICDLRIKFLVSLFLSSGVRVGSLDYFHAGDIREFKIDEHVAIGALTVYKREPEQYPAFCSSECLALWKEYRDERERLGEIVSDDSPLIRNMTSIFEPKAARPLKSNAVRALFSVLWTKTGLTERPFKEVHGWRKFFKTSLESSGMKSVRVERLLGHIQGLAQSYDKPSLLELAKDYASHQHLLTIDQSLVAKTELKEIQETTEREFKNYRVDLILANQRTAEIQELLKGEIEERKKLESEVLWMKANFQSNLRMRRGERLGPIDRAEKPKEKKTRST